MCPTCQQDRPDGRCVPCGWNVPGGYSPGTRPNGGQR